MPDTLLPARILVVDDAATVRLYHHKILSDAGWRVDDAGNGLEALERVLAMDSHDSYGLLVVDVNMPKMDGYRLVREIRQQAALPQMPVLMVSTEAQMHDRHAALDAGANAYIVKPAKPQELVLTAALLLGDRTRAENAASALAATRTPLAQGVAA
jgi:two-component system chemotaxis response regulator CheY